MALQVQKKAKRANNIGSIGWIFGLKNLGEVTMRNQPDQSLDIEQIVNHLK
jgi:hypothetical protein